MLGVIGAANCFCLIFNLNGGVFSIIDFKQRRAGSPEE